GLRLVRASEARGGTGQVGGGGGGGGGVAGGKQAVMADAVEAVGQDVGEESSDELVGVQCHCLPPFGSIDAVILPAEGDAVVVGRDQSTVGDGDAVGIAG